MRQPRLSVPVVCAVWIAAAVAAEPDALHQAAAAFERGDYAAAEKELRPKLRATPGDAAALGLLAVVLDNQGKLDEAGEYYRHALVVTPHSASLLNNYGNHLLKTGQKVAARAAFLKVVDVNPAHPNANAQLARLALDDKDGPDASRYLDRLPAEAQRSPEAALLRLRALYLSGRDREAEPVLESLAPAARGDPRLSFSAGLALAAAGQYEKAETFFSQALDLVPADFDVLYNLGLAASHAGHQERAYTVLQTALQVRPDDVDALYNLGAIDAALRRNDGALVWLARAAKQAPDRADVQRLLAQTTSSLGYYADSALAWDRYFKLAPKDDTARRERGFTTALAGQRQDGLVDLEWYVARHPRDANGHYETAIAQSFEPDAALPHLNQAIALRPDFTSAYYARGVLLYTQNKLPAALADFLAAAKQEPENAATLDKLGRTYLALDRATDALPVLRRAAELNPRDSKTLMHLARALTGTGQTEEARQIIARFRALGPDRGKSGPNPGFVDLLALPPEQQYERYRARVEKAVAADPNDAPAKLRYLKLLLGDEAWPQAEAVAREIVALKPGPAVEAEAGRALLDADRYATAAELLRQCPQAPGAALDLAIAVFHADGADAGLQLMDAVPQVQRDGDYYLARAQMLDQGGRFMEAATAAQQALRAAPTRVALYCQVTLFLIKNGRLLQALELLDQATRYVPDNPSILLAKVISLEVAARSVEAAKLLKEIERRWPEWPEAHLVDGIILQTHRSPEEALRELTTATALGAREPAGYYYLAEATLQAKPDESEAAQRAIQEALALDSGDAWAHALAGRICYERGQYDNALKELREAVRLRPQLVQAHYNLARVYSALGRGQDARNESEQVRELRERFPHEAEDPDLLHSNLFGVTFPQR